MVRFSMTEGTKYHPLFEYLLFSGQGRLTLSFAEIEAIVGAPLPPSARKREEWWSNSPSGHSQARAWMRASYRTSNVDLADKKVDFSLEGWPEGYSRVNIRTLAGHDTSGLAEATQAPYEGSNAGERSQKPDHPLFGIWKGRVTLVADYDYTQPAFEPDKTP
ncbi:MAG: hypothetical protein NTV73_02200 [Hyphomicrobiales bacterium]|nr:hypothetical protein [Hyphomicrobiales bacterium]